MGDTWQPFCARMLPNTSAEVKWERTYLGNWIRGWWGGKLKEPGWKIIYSLLIAMNVMDSLMTTVSQDLGLTSYTKDRIFYSTVSPSSHWSLLENKEEYPYWPRTTTSFSQEFPYPSPNQAHTWFDSAIWHEPGAWWYGCFLCWFWGLCVTLQYGG